MNVKKSIPDLKTEEIKIIGNVKFEIYRSVKNGFILKKIKVDGNIFDERVKALALEDFKKYFAETGFQIKDIFGDYDLSNFEGRKSGRLIIVANKK